VIKQTYRRWAGLILGALIGLAFGGVSQAVNLLFLPGIPLYQPPFGPDGNLLLALLTGALLGLICAWVERARDIVGRGYRGSPAGIRRIVWRRNAFIDAAHQHHRDNIPVGAVYRHALPGYGFVPHRDQ